MTKPRLIFMGTPEFAHVILADLHTCGDYEIVAVYVQPDKPVGRGNKVTSPPVAMFAKSIGLTVLQPQKIRDPQILQELKSFCADIIVVAAYGKILPVSVLSAAKVGCINVHASLLPRWRGAAPINHALLQGDAETGVAIMKVIEALDAGPVYLEKKITITDADDAATLTEKLARLGAAALREALPGILSGTLAAHEQNTANVTYATKLDKSFSRVDWNRPAHAIVNQVRALVPWPVAETVVTGKRLKIYHARLLNEAACGEPGQIVHIAKEGWTVAAKDHNILVTEVQLEGKKRMSAFDVANGLRLSVGTVLG